MAHNPAILFQVEKRGLSKRILCRFDFGGSSQPLDVTKDNILYKCGWSPFEGTIFKSRITHTILNGSLVYHNAQFSNHNAAMRLTFNR